MDQTKQLLEQSGFKCKKCSYYSPIGKGLEINKDFREVLCTICNTFAPQEKQQFDSYISEKINWQNLETFRKFNMNRSSHLAHKKGMIRKAKEGKLVARPAFGYDVREGELILNEDSENVRLIFQEFAGGKSLNQLAKSYGLSVNGIKKILKNFTYLGKIRFDNQISQGNHKPIITPELFNEVQKLFDSKKRKVSLEINNKNSQNE